MSANEDIRQSVQSHYGALARQAAAGKVSSCCSTSAGSDCCSSADGMTSLGEVSILNLGCGQPVQHANLQPGERVVDLGSGAGLDIFRAAQIVGPSGLATGVDMTPDMIIQARKNALKLGIQNARFVHGYLEKIPLPDESADVFISNCVVNLSPDKPAVFSEVARVLRPGGRLVFADIVSRGPLADVVPTDEEAWCACVAGALDIDEYVELLEEAGFEDVSLVPDQDFNQISEIPVGTPFPALIYARKPA